MPTHDPATVQAVARAIFEQHYGVTPGLSRTWQSEHESDRRYWLASANAALSAPPVAAAFAALAEVERLLDPERVIGLRTSARLDWPTLTAANDAWCRDIRAALPTPTTEETTHA